MRAPIIVLLLVAATALAAGPGPAPAPKATVTFTQGTHSVSLPATSPNVCIGIQGSVIRGSVGTCTAGSFVQFPKTGGDVSTHWSAQDVCPVQPAPLTRHADCPVGTKGSGWTQTATYATADAPTCWVLGAYLPTDAPAGVCVVQPPTNGLPPGSTVNVLWVGNSLTSTPPDFNDYTQGPLPVRIAPMLAELGITLQYTAAIQGGAEFADHAANPATMALIADARFDAVNLQGYYHFFDTAAHFQSAVQPLYNAAHAAGSSALFEGMWGYHDPGGPLYPASATSVEGAAITMAGSFPVPLIRAWNQISTIDPALFAKMYYDGTHQSSVGEYLNALCYTRFFSGKSVASINSISTFAAARTSATERAEIKSACDAAITVFYTGTHDGGTTPPPTNQPPVAHFTVTTSGLAATFTDTSTDPDGSIASRAWGFGDGTTGSGATVTHTFPSAATYPVILNVTDNGNPPLGASTEQNVTVSAGAPPSTLKPPVDQTALVPFAKPARGVPITTQFGTTETRVTDHAADRPGSTCARNDYSRRQPFNADKSRVLIYECGGSWLVYKTNPIAFEKVLAGPAADAEIQWSPTDPDKLYYLPTNGGSKLYEHTISTNSSVVYVDLAPIIQPAIPTADRYWTKSEGSPSADNSRWGFMAQKYNQATGNFDMYGFAVVDVVAKRLLWSRQTTIAPDHVSMTPSGRYFVPSGDDSQGTYAVRVSDGATCQLHHKSEHSDIGKLANGDDFYVSVDFQAGNGDVFFGDIDACFTQPGPTRALVRTVATHVYNNTWLGPHYSEHFSAKAFNRPGFFSFSGYGYAPAPLLLYDTAAATWYGIGATMTTCGDYFCEIQAALSRDGRSLMFNDAFGATADVDAYRVDLP